MRHCIHPFLTLVLVFVFALLVPVPAQAELKTDERTLGERVNNERSSHGLTSLIHSDCISKGARDHSYYMATSGSYVHSIYTGKNVVKEGCGVRIDYGENIASAKTELQAFTNLLASECHNANITSRLFSYPPCKVTGDYGSIPYTHMGIGTYRHTNGTIYVTQVFVQCASSCEELQKTTSGTSPEDAPNDTDSVPATPENYTNSTQNNDSIGNNAELVKIDGADSPNDTSILLAPVNEDGFSELERTARSGDILGLSYLQWALIVGVAFLAITLGAVLTYLVRMYRFNRQLARRD